MGATATTHTRKCVKRSPMEKIARQKTAKKAMIKATYAATEESVALQRIIDVDIFIVPI